MAAGLRRESRRRATDLKNPVPDSRDRVFSWDGPAESGPILFFPPPRLASPGRLPDYLTGSSQSSVRNDEAGMPLVLKSEASA